MKNIYLVTNSASEARRISLSLKQVGIRPCSLQEFFTSIYLNPNNFLKAKKIFSEDSFAIDSRMIEIGEKLEEKNYFKKSLKIKSVRDLINRGLEEIKISGISVEDLLTVEFDNQDKKNSLVELYKIWNENKRFSYTDMLFELRRMELSLDDTTIIYSKDLSFSGIEEDLFNDLLKKSKSSELIIDNSFSEKKLAEKIKEVNFQAKISEENIVLDLFKWMFKNKINCTDCSVLAFNYDDYAPHFYHFSQKYEVPIYLSNGILCKNFDFFYRIISEVHNLKNEKSGFQKIKNILVKKSEEELENVLNLKLLSLFHDIHKYSIDTGISEMETFSLFFDRASRIKFSSKDLGSNSNGLFIGSPADFENTEVNHFAVLGLESRNYPILESLNPILTSFERKLINVHLGTKLNLLDDQRYENFLEKILSRTKGKIYLSLCSHDKTTGKINLPSTLFNKLIQLNGEETSLESIYKKFNLPSDLADDIDSSNLFLNLQAGESWAISLREFNKKVFSKSINDLDYGSTIEPIIKVSASGLESFLKCPYKFYLSKINGIKHPEVFDPDITKWMDHLMKGSFLHKLYELILRPFVDKKRKDYKNFLLNLNNEDIEEALLKAQKELSLDKYRLNVPVYIRESELLLLKNELEAFIFNEIKYANDGFYPIELEFDFEDKNIDYKGIKLSGVIDRIDMNDDLCFRVIDYKTGSNKIKNKTNFFVDEGGHVHVQHGFYGLVTKTLFQNARQIEAGFYFSTQKEDWFRAFQLNNQFEEHFEKILELFFREAQTGKYFKNCKSCKFCDYKSICSMTAQRRNNFRTDAIEQLIKIDEVLNEDS
jgi:CRISPR/Cas system-associated exonuclease Cas4 (RecB family)